MNEKFALTNKDIKVILYFLLNKNIKLYVIKKRDKNVITKKIYQK